MPYPNFRYIKRLSHPPKKGQAWGLKTVESFRTYGTPPVDVGRS
jgi:catechol 2,3-dioxygenase